MQPAFRRFVLFLLTLWLVSGPAVSALAGQRLAGSEDKTAAIRPVTLPSGAKIDLEVADTPQARHQGLMFRDRLPNDGLLFIFQNAAPHRFWMKNCKFPIDILWLTPQKVITHIAENVPPCSADPCPTYGPERDSLYALEVAAGFAKRAHLAPGLRLGF